MKLKKGLIAELSRGFSLLLFFLIGEAKNNENHYYKQGNGQSYQSDF